MNTIAINMYKYIYIYIKQPVELFPKNMVAHISWDI